MTLTPYQIGKFNGLSLAEPDELGANDALDILNVDLDKPGAIRTRDGYSKFNGTLAGTNLGVVYGWAGKKQVITGSTATIYAFDSTGTVIASNSIGVTALSPKTGAATLGTGSAGPYLFLAVPLIALPGNWLRWDGATWTTQAATAANVLAVQSPDNRIVAVDTASSTQASRVKFSDAGAPTTFGANNYVEIRPNDGQKVRGLVAWRDYVFAFKDTCFGLFYGNSMDGSGNPVFNMRIVDTGIGLGQYGAPLSTYCAAPEGVYFASPSGIYLTTGGPPSKVSGALDPFFQAASATSGFFTPSGASFNPTDMLYSNGRLYVAFSDGTGSYIFVYYRQSEQWSVWQTAVPVFSITAVQLADTGPPTIIFTGNAVSGRMYKFDPTVTTDDGTAIASRYRSGFYSPIGSPSQECVIRESIIDGIGTPTFSVSKDFATAPPTTGGGAKGTVTLGTSPTYAQGRHRISQKGRRFSWQIEASSGAWRLNSAVQMIRSKRPPGIKST